MKSSHAYPDRSHRQIQRAASGTKLSRHGMTLVEMLVAMALSLLIILAVTQVFRLVGDNVLASRAVLEMAGQLRGAADQLQSDLDGLTVPVRPWPDASSGLGYFEYHEGPLWDMGITHSLSGVTLRYPESSVGDIDDVLMFTARSKGEPFAGQILGTIDYTNPNRPRLLYNPAAPQMSVIYSQVAEIAWFTRFNDWNGDSFPDPGEVTLHRRVFLVLPNLDLSLVQGLSSLEFYSAFDISVATVETTPGNWTRRANSLEDLTRRESRIAHYGSGASPVTPPPSRAYPYHFWPGLLAPQGTVMTPGINGTWGNTGNVSDAGQFGSDDLAVPVDVLPVPLLAPFAETYGNDVILSQLLAFDVKAYDPYAPTRQSASTVDALTPGDPGYAAAGLAIGQGAFVDLYYNRYLGASPAASLFSGGPSARSAVGTAPVIWGTPSFSSTYDTWSLYYEHNGVNEDSAFNAITDQATNGFDDDGINGVDDVGERETAPPYPVPLRGIEVRLRIIDNDSRQVRQVTVSTNFIPE